MKSCILATSNAHSRPQQPKTFWTAKRRKRRLGKVSLACRHPIRGLQATCSLLVAPAKSIDCVAEQRKKNKLKHLLLIVANTGCLRLLSEQAAAEKSTPFVCAKEGLPCGGFWPACTSCFSRFISSRNPHPQSSFFFDFILIPLCPSPFLSLLAVHFHTQTNNKSSF